MSPTSGLREIPLQVKTEIQLVRPTISLEKDLSKSGSPADACDNCNVES